MADLPRVKAARPFYSIGSAATVPYRITFPFFYFRRPFLFVRFGGLTEPVLSFTLHCMVSSRLAID